MIMSFSNITKVSFVRMLSSVVLLWCISVRAALSHEVLPAIADMEHVEGRLEFTINANVESFIAGIDLAEVADTDEAAQAATYDELRSLEPAALSSTFIDFWDQMRTQIDIQVDGEAASLILDGIDVSPVGNVELVRDSAIRFHVKLPEDAENVTVGWAPDYGVLLLRQIGVDAPYDGYLDVGTTSPPIALSGGDQATGWQSFLRYIPVGFDHIVPKGLDHILFVLGLFFLAARFRPLLIQVSVFTLAHTITLALAALGHTKFLDEFFINTFGIESIKIVEPLIALSIAYVAIENILLKGITKWRPFVIFVFGLLHGLGFASVLTKWGIPEQNFVLALIGFNVGVELGQLAVIAVMFLCVWQALRIDRGQNEVGQSYTVYAVLIIAAIAVIALSPMISSTTVPVTLEENPLLLFSICLLGIFVLCIISIRCRDQLQAYRRIVAVPASVAIAFVGLYWFIERAKPLI